MTLLSHGFQAEYEIGFANGVARNGTDVTLIGSDNTLVKRAANGVKVTNLRGSQATDRPTLSKVFNLTRYIVRYLLHLALRRGQAVHLIGMFSTRSTVVSLIEAWLTRLVAGRYVLTVHNLLPHDSHTAFNRWAFGLLYRAPGRLVVHTQRMAEALAQDFGIQPARILVVEHGIDRFFTPNAELRASWRAEHGIPAQAKVALLFGMVARYKGPDLLLRAFESAGNDRNVYLVIAGRCRDAALRDEMNNMLATHPYRARIIWRDAFVPDGEVERLMQGCDCMVMPYRHIDQSGVLFMALSSGLRMVATDVGSFAAYIHPGAGEIVAAGDMAAFSSAMTRQLSNTSSLTREHLMTAAARYEWRNTSRTLSVLYAGEGSLSTNSKDIS